MTRHSIRSAGRLSMLLLATSVPAGASVSELGSNGFTVTLASHIAAAPDKVYAALIKPERWWASDHTFSGKAENLHLDARAGGCWCETLPDGGSVMHLTVVMASPGKVLRLRGGLGPFQGLGAEGALSFSLKSNGEGTELMTVYALGGYNKGGFKDLAQAADGVLTSQLGRLKKFVESGSP